MTLRPPIIQYHARALSGVLALFVTSSCVFEPQLPEASAREDDEDSQNDAGSQSDDLTEQVSSVFDTLNTTVYNVRAFECDCEVAGTNQTVAECVDATLSVTPPPIVQCSIDMLATDERSLDSLHCEAQAGVDYLACLETSTCSDFDNILSCQVAHDTYQRSNCVSLPWELWAKVQTECYGIEQPPPFTCADGEIINSEWVCDLEPDCQDGSDEIACHP
jgi:hypothetical protein